MEVRFIDRVEELNKLLKYAERGFYPVLYLYGSEGCGKTRLLKEFYSRVGSRSDFVAVYVDAQYVEDLRGAVYAPPEVLELIVEVAKGFVGPAGRVAALALLRAVKKVKEYLVRDKHIAILVDDVAKPLGLEMIEIYAKNMLNIVEELLSHGAKSVVALATTSEGVSRAVLARHNYVSLAQMWNLGYEAFNEMLTELRAPSNVFESAWQVLGGNPRLLIALKLREWRLETLEEDLYRSVRAVLESMARRFRRELIEVVEDVDRVLDYPELGRYLLETNLITPVDRPCMGYTPPIDEELGIGRFYAWQTPLHRRLVDRFLKGYG